MGNQLVWQDRFIIGVDSIDKEHKKLFSILNRLLMNQKDDEKSQWVCKEGIKYFKDHAMKHFADEESYMASINYIDFETHRRLHEDFRKKTLPALEKELEETAYSKDSINHFLGVCAGWLIGHTLTEDHAITGKTLSKWTNLLPDQEQKAMTQTITDVLYDIFRLEPKLVSECYSGEKFGKGIYYRLVYGDKKNEKLEIMLVFEEKLIINTVGKMINIKSDTISVMLINMARYTARQFVERVREHFPSSENYEVKEENLLSYEQFQKIFNNKEPQFSLLFDTGEGYFAYCAIAPHLIEKGDETAIKTENAMVEIEKYLKKNNTSNKKNILLVDDSMVVLHAMEELLGKDYDIATAKSGLSAIRSITLNRPDLVLLDYEMPVCNGQQVLEMIRSEEDIADIPIIFLTATVDVESVKKLIALKPAGYLLKTLPPLEIKKNIDEYFKKTANKH